MIAFWSGDKVGMLQPIRRISGPVLDRGMSDPLQQLRQRCVLLTGHRHILHREPSRTRIRLNQEVGG